MRSQLIIFGVYFSVFCQGAFAGDECPKTEYGKSYRGNNPTVNSIEIIKRNSPIFEDGEIKCNIDMDYRKPNTNVRSRTETGTYKNIKYRFYYTDGSGTIQGDENSTLDTIKDLHIKNWSTSCKKDAMDDKHWCTLTKEDVTFGIWKNGTYFINVGHSHYPRSKVTLRVDKNQPISISSDGEFSKKQIESLLSQIKNGQDIISRYQEWPYESNIDKTTSLYGFNAAWEILNAIYKEVK